MSETMECRCGRPTRDKAFVCETCQHALEKALGDIRWLDEELETTMTRQKSATIDGGSPSAERGLPWHDKAADARRTLHSLLVLWVRFCGEEGVRGAPARQPRDTLGSLSAWLLNVTHGLTLLDIGSDAVDEITDAVAEAERIVFWKRKSRDYLGTCGQVVKDDDGEVISLSCPGEVYAEEGDQIGTCDDCGQGVTVVIRKADLNQQLDDRLFTAAEIARLATFLGLKQPREKVRTKVLYWHRREIIKQKMTDDKDHPMFRYGDVKALLYREFGRESA